ncbi:hypothetical protein WR25_20499 [Diploscapter pachys]|uniref:Glycosyltransferase family 92 protein n=1 Tax=Diploscapter pachys TaxID=2018661 RepID=A0A2A2JRU4_9BILA|nr:hypothetical protein WR25_20499 [Diploscapter pachys]
MNMFLKTIYCHYFDKRGKNIGKPFKSFVFPESVIYCARRPKAKFISISETEDGRREPPIIFIDRTNPVAEHFFSVCLAPAYGDEPKWLFLAEFIEHYKIQGATYFFIYITDDLEPYDRVLLDDYVRTGNVEVISIVDRLLRDPRDWQTIQIHDCLLRNRYFSNWTAFVDMDERLLMNESGGTLEDFLMNITQHDSKIGSVTFRQRWIHKSDNLPKRYKDVKQVKEWMPTQRYHNTTMVTPPGWVVKSIVQPHKVLYMWTHYPRKMYNGYRGYSVKPEQGVSRHYRLRSRFVWDRIPNRTHFEYTDYPAKYNDRLVDAVTQRLKYVYEFEAEESYRMPKYLRNWSEFFY